MITYKNANGITVLVRFDKDTQARYTFNVREWEVGVAAHTAYLYYPRAEQLAFAVAEARKGGVPL